VKRDLALVRKLMLYIETNCGPDRLDSTAVSVKGYTDDEIGYSLDGVINGRPFGARSGGGG